MMASRRVVAFGLGVLLTLTGCSRTERSVKRPDEALTLRLGYTPSEETIADREEATRALAGYLERTLGNPVVIVRTASYGPAIAAMERGEIDVMGLGPLAYVMAADSGTVEAIAVTGQEGGAPRTYQSALIGRQGFGIERLEDLPSRVDQVRFNYTDPASNSGHLVPDAKLRSLGLTPDRDFASVDFTLSHTVAIFNVAFNKADVAGVNYRVFERLVNKKRVSADQVNVLWRSEPLPLGPVAVRRALPAELKRRLQEALITLHHRDYATWKIVMAQYPDPGLVYLRCNDALYDGLRALARSVAPL